MVGVFLRSSCLGFKTPQITSGTVVLSPFLSLRDGWPYDSVLDLRFPEVYLMGNGFCFPSENYSLYKCGPLIRYQGPSFTEFYLKRR